MVESESVASEMKSSDSEMKSSVKESACWDLKIEGGTVIKRIGLIIVVLNGVIF